MNEISKKIVSVTVGISFFAGLIGGALTNEYLIAYIGSLLGDQIEENDPIVKRVIEQHQYIESSDLTQTVELIEPTVLKLFLASGKSINAVVLTADGLIASSNLFLKKNYKYSVQISGDDKRALAKVVHADVASGVKFLQLEMPFEDGAIENLQAVDFADLTVTKLGQRVVSLNQASSNLSIKTGVISQKSEFDLKFDLNSPDDLGVVFNLKGQLMALGSVNGFELQKALDVFLALNK